MVDLFAWLNVLELEADSHTFRGAVVLTWPIILFVLVIVLIPLFIGMSAVQIAKTPKAIVKNLPFLKKEAVKKS